MQVSFSKNIIFINHKPANCGVYHYGRRVYDILKKSNQLKIIYKEVDEEPDLEGCNTVLYNYHQLTMPWLQKVPDEIYSFVIPHCPISIKFDKIIDINPKISIPRPIFEDFTRSTNNFIEYRKKDTPIFGSFGFGFLSKGFDKIIKSVNEQYEKAIIKLVIPTAKFSAGDLNFQEYYGLAKPDIEILITHEFFTDNEILTFLESNDMNIFLYDSLPHNGISSVIDFAVSVGKPLAISDSCMFEHIYDDSICVYKTPLPEIMKNSVEYCKQFQEKYSHKNFIDAFNKLLLDK